MRGLLKRLSRTAAVQWLLALLIGIYVLTVWYTSRKVVVGSVKPGQKIIALWHGRLVLATFFDRSHWPLYTLSSAHIDGLIVTKAARLHGVRAVYGSTREGALSGFRQALRVAQNGASLLFTPDGPTGPRMHAQPGVAEFARFTGLPVVPVSFSAKRSVRIKSWDKAMLPLPFTTLVMVYGQPLHLARNTEAAGVEYFLETLAKQLIDVQDKADALTGVPATPRATPEEVERRRLKHAWKTRKIGFKR